MRTPGPVAAWPQCADHRVAPLCRSSNGSHVPVGDIHTLGRWPTGASLRSLTGPTSNLPLRRPHRLGGTIGSFHCVGCCSEWPLRRCSTGRSGSAAVHHLWQLNGPLQTGAASQAKKRRNSTTNARFTLTPAVHSAAELARWRLNAYRSFVALRCQRLISTGLTDIISVR